MKYTAALVQRKKESGITKVNGTVERFAPNARSSLVNLGDFLARDVGLGELGV
jgi:hypothetical protein